MSEAQREIGGPSFHQELLRITECAPRLEQRPTMDEIWLRACAQAYFPHEAYEIIELNNATESGAAIFRRRRGLLASKLYLLGNEDSSLLTDTFYRDEEDARLLANAVVKCGRPICFGHFPAKSLFVGALQQAAIGKGHVLSDPLAGLMYINLDKSWTELEQKFSASRQSELRRRWKKARQHGDVSLEFLSPTPSNVDALLDEFIAVEASGWKSRAGTAIACNDSIKAFIKQYSRLASEKNILRLCFLRINGKAVASTLATESYGAFWQFKIGYDEAYKNCAPGTLLQLECVRHAAAAGLSRYEFLGNAPWMQEWTTDEHPLMRFKYYPYNYAGAETFMSDAFTFIAKRVKTRLSRSA